METNLISLSLNVRANIYDLEAACAKSSFIQAKLATGLPNVLPYPDASARARREKKRFKISARPLRAIFLLFGKMVCRFPVIP
jgi:hypothetical protein